MLQTAIQSLSGWWNSEPNQRSALDNPNLDLRDPESWEEVFGASSKSESGEVVSTRRAVGYPAFRQGVTMLSGDIAKLPLAPHRVREDGTTEEDTRHPAYRICKHYPNEKQAAFTFWRHLMTHAIIWSHGYAVILRNAVGQPSSMLPLLSDRTVRLETGNYVSEIGGKLTGIHQSQIFHLQNMCIGDGDDCQLISDCRDTIGLGLAASNFASRFFKHGGRMGGVLMLPAAMGDKSKDSIERGFRKTYEHKDAQFRVMVLRDNAKFAQAQFDPDKGQMTLSRQEQVKEVARILNMPAHKLGHDGRTAYNSLEVEEKSYLNSSLSHWLNAIRGEAAIKLLSGTQRQRLTHVFVHDLDALISTDSDTRARVGRTEIEMGALSPNEYRKQRGMPPRDGGDVFLVPLNMSPNADDPDEGSPTEADDSQDEAERQIVAEAFQQGKRATAATVIRYAKKMTAQRFVTWWDERGPEELRSMHDAETQLVRARFGVEDDGTVSDLAGQVSRAIEETTVEAFTDTIITIAENWKCATDI